MRHRRATINESFGAWEFLYINSGCPVRGEELVHFQFYCEDFHSKTEYALLELFQNLLDIPLSEQYLFFIDNKARHTHHIVLVL